MVDQLGLKPSSRYLDVGCGTGIALRHAANQYIKAEQGGVVVGLDSSPYILRVARALCSAEAPAITFEQGSILAPPFPPGQRFTHITCMNLVYFFERKDELFASLAGLLAPGGVLCIGVKDFDFLLANFGRDGGVFFLATDDELKKAMAGAGLVVDEKPVHSVPNAAIEDHKHLLLGEDDQKISLLIARKPL